MSHQDEYYYDDEEDEVLDAIEAEMDRDLHSDNVDHLLTSAMNNTSLFGGGVGGSTNYNNYNNHNSNNNTAAAAAASSSLPSHQVNHAAEFWFPECRDCSCCNGFKHGCPCGGLCTCSGGVKAGNSNVSNGPQVGGGGGVSGGGGSNYYGAGSNNNYTNTNNGGRGFSGGRGNGRGGGQGRSFGGGGGNSGKIPCRFHQMGTCKFGDGCRFSHE